MGYDKPDLRFVVHYQRPGSVVAYYQQVGRVGRAIDWAVAVLLNGREDDEIQEYFIRAAFPTTEDMLAVVKVLERSSGMLLGEILRRVNLSEGRVQQILKLLVLDGAVGRDGSKYFRTPNPLNLNLPHQLAAASLRWSAPVMLMNPDSSLRRRSVRPAPAVTLVSGGAKGADRISMQSCLNGGGTVAGALSDGLELVIREPGYRSALASGRLVLVSAVHPKARYATANAMARNKYIYGLARYGLVVVASLEKGGDPGGCPASADVGFLSGVLVKNALGGHCLVAGAGHRQRSDRGE